MTSQAKAHEADIKTILQQKNPKNLDVVITQHLLWIGFMQHERIIHLIITFFFAFIEISLVLLITVIGVVTWWLSFITLIITILLFFYIWHYYFLENTCQRWYTYADLLREIGHNSKG